MTPLSLTHLRLSLRATTDVILDGHMAGNNLRNALANVMLHATCPETHRRAKPTPEHAAACPACWLLAAETDPGSVVRAYAVVPPLPPRERVSAGESFAFGLTLFGDGFRFLPYIVLAAAEMGRVGVGPGRRDGLGRFRLEEIWSFNPYTGERRQLLAPDSSLVRVEAAPIEPAHAAAAAVRLDEQLSAGGHALSVRFLSPTRLEENGRLFRAPDFAVFFRRLLYRIDDLARQFAGGERRDPDSVAALARAADRVRLVDARTHWVDLWSWSGRKGEKTPVGGFIGTAVYQTDDWLPLLPWLLLGQGTQVGKSTVKGAGVFEVGAPAPAYWDWLVARPDGELQGETSRGDLRIGFA